LVLNAEMRFCVRHLYGNFRNQWRGLKLKSILWKVVIACGKEDYEERMKLLEKECKAWHAYLLLAGKEMWTRSHFLTNRKFDLLCNNICEAWNKYILEARDKPVITLLEMIKKMMIIRFQTERILAEAH